MPGSLPSRWSVAGMVAVAAMAATAGCAALQEQDPARGASDALSLPEENIARWVLPFDEFLVSDQMMAKESYARTLALVACATERGADVEPVPYVDFDSAYADGARTRYTLTRAQAAQIGYHHPVETPPAALAPWTEYRRLAVPETEQTVLEACGEELEPDLPGYDVDSVNFTSDFVVVAYQGATSSEAVESAADEWRECMAPQGIEDLPDDPQAMPSESIQQKYQTSGGRDGETLGPITPAEVALALADVECREASGYQRELYDAIWTREARLLEENQTVFEEQRAAIEAADAEIDRVIAQYATAGGSS